MYQRLKVFPIEIPPLRERREDIKELLMYFSNIKDEKALHEAYEEEVLHFLLNEYAWVGNVRELENTVRGASIRKKVLEVERINSSTSSFPLISTSFEKMDD